MGRLTVKRNWGRETENQYPLLVRQLDSMYGDITNIVSSTTKKYAVEGKSAPDVDEINKQFDIGDIWVRTDIDRAWVMTSRTSPTNVTWTQIT